MIYFWALALFSALSIVGSIGQLGSGNGCCTQFSICGQTFAYCATGCQTQCTSTGGDGAPSSTPTTPSTGGNNISSLISITLFNQMLKHRDDARCPGRGFYTYDAFIAATKSFKGFGTTGDMDTRKREIAAFLAQTSHETSGGWSSAPDGPYAWGYCYVQEQFDSSDYCDKSSVEWPCTPGKIYCGRGPIQITYNFNYGQAGRALGVDLLNNPDLVVTDATISFKTALWFWTTRLSASNQSCHDVMTGANGRVYGYGATTNIINGGIECRNVGQGTQVSQSESRIGFYKRYCDILKVGYGIDLEC